MRNYEIMVLLDPTIADEDKPSIIDSLSNIITTHNGTVDKTDELGKRKLAYEIDKHTEAIYALIYASIESSSDFLDELERFCKYHEKILRYMIVKIPRERRSKKRLKKEAKRAKRRKQLAARSERTYRDAPISAESRRMPPGAGGPLRPVRPAAPSSAPSPLSPAGPVPAPEVSPAPTPEVTQTPAPTPEVAPAPALSPEVTPTPAPTPEVAPTDVPTPEVTPTQPEPVVGEAEEQAPQPEQQSSEGESTTESS